MGILRGSAGIGAIVLGVLGTLICVAAIGVGWWTAVRTADRTTRAAARIDHGLTETDARLAQIQERLAAIRADLDEVRGEAERLAAENPELPRVRAAIERLLDRLIPTIDRAAALATSLRTVAAGLRSAADLRDLVIDEVEPPDRTRNAAVAIDRGAELLSIPRTRIDAIKSATAVRLVRELVELTRHVVAGSELVAEGLADARRALADARDQVTVWRDKLVFWIYCSAGVHTFAWLWIGLGQLCLIGWGRRRFVRRTPMTADAPPRPNSP